MQPDHCKILCVSTRKVMYDIYGERLSVKIDLLLTHLPHDLPRKGKKRRKAIFHAPQELVPVLLPFVSQAYGGRMWAFLRGTPHDSSSALCNGGVRQGGPLGPFCSL
jgi:hypothetical protein